MADLLLSQSDGLDKKLVEVDRQKGGLAVIFGLGDNGIGGAVTMLLVCGVLAAIALIDWKTQYIPPQLNLFLALLGVLSVWTLPGPTVVERLIGAVSVSVPMILIVLAVPGGFGWGDIKMMAAAGVLLGWKDNAAAFFIAVILGGAYGAYLLLTKKKGRKDHFAFGPFLSIGIVVALFTDIGTAWIDGYVDMLVRMTA
jgi:leader peptidase (prepilin peptidase)/N-methyltransferase